MEMGMLKRFFYSTNILLSIYQYKVFTEHILQYNSQNGIWILIKKTNHFLKINIIWDWEWQTERKEIYLA